jgi:SAM-dependent methyltransferase
MLSALRELISFNQLNRDRWVADLATGMAPGTSILDVGAGTCRYACLFTHCLYRSQDFMQYEGTQTGIARDDWGYGRIDYVSDATDIPIPDATFDAVLCTEVLEHVLDPVAVIAEAARVVKPRGRIFLSAPLGSGLHQQPHHYYGGFTPHFYRSILEREGCSVDSIAPNGGFFRLLLQEIHRAGVILRDSGRYRRWSPLVLAFRVGSVALAPLLTYLDDKIPVSEFTVGFHVVATKK